jgi:predicted RNase H-like nuclease (RuvC/YqgF family)
MKNRKQTLERLIQEQSAIVEKARKDFEELNTDLQGKIELSVYLTMQMETLSRLYVKLFECK